MIVERASASGFLTRLAGSSFYTNFRFAVIPKLRVKPQVPCAARACRSGPARARSPVQYLPVEEQTPWLFEMVERVLRLLFRCSHKRLTLPMTPMTKSGAGTGRPYVVCLDCGGQFAYDWKEMRVGERLDRPGRQQHES